MGWAFCGVGFSVCLVVWWVGWDADYGGAFFDLFCNSVVWVFAPTLILI